MLARRKQPFYAARTRFAALSDRSGDCGVLARIDRGRMRFRLVITGAAGKPAND